jgi:hypothetical protein
MTLVLPSDRKFSAAMTDLIWPACIKRFDAGGRLDPSHAPATARNKISESKDGGHFIMNNAAIFIRSKWPYVVGFAVVEAGIFYFDGPTGNFTTGFPAFFFAWLFYRWMAR